ncbi:MAG: NAD(P)H-binding protein [Proteobacteria bacterium]|nr:NAD(P)H-binding protein [Pseudomonadota bacterium]
MLVMMGATGQVGGAALEALKRRGVTVRAIARDPERARHLGGPGIGIVPGEATDTASLVAAFQGAEAAFVMLAPPMQAADVLAESRVAAQSIASAIRAARVPHVVALSSAGAGLAEGNGIVRTLHDFEQALAGAAPSLVFLRPGDFIENWAAMLPAVRAAGVLPSAKLPLDGAGETVSALDVGRTVAELLLDPRPGARIVNLTGPKDYSPADAAAALSELLGKPVMAVPSSRDETIAALQASGASADYAAKLADLTDAVNAGRLRLEAGEGEMRRGTVTLKEALQRLVSAGRP